MLPDTDFDYNDSNPSEVRVHDSEHSDEKSHNEDNIVQLSK